MYARGMTTREIQGHLEEIYGVEVSPSLISSVTDAVIEEVKKPGRAGRWSRCIRSCFWTLLMVKMRHEGRVENRAVLRGRRHRSGRPQRRSGTVDRASEGAKFWLQVLTEIRNRGVKDILIACWMG